MTRAQIRDLLRRQIKNTASVQWPDDSELNGIINTAYTLVQKEVRKIDPEAHITWDRMSLEAGVNWYPLPPTFSVIQVQLLDEASGLYYPITPKGFRTLGNVQATTGQPVNQRNISRSYYALRGQFIGIFPTPTAAVTDGLEILHCRIMSLAADEETPAIKTPLHLAIMYWAKLICLGDTDENTDETRTRLQELLGDLGTWYNHHSDESEKFIVSI